MDIIGLIKNVLSALTSYLELKNKSFYYDIIQKGSYLPPPQLRVTRICRI